MKQLMLFFVLVIVCLASCTTQEDLLTTRDNNNAFMRLVEQDIYPANQLSEEAIQHFNEHLVIDNGEILGGDFSLVQAELSEEDFQGLFELMFGQEVAFVDEIPETDEGGERFKSNPCIMTLLIDHFPKELAMGAICKQQPRRFCKTCIYYPID